MKCRTACPCKTAAEITLKDSHGFLFGPQVVLVPGKSARTKERGIEGRNGGGGKEEMREAGMTSRLTRSSS